MVTSLVLRSEDLDEDSILTYPQFTEFSIRFGLMSERASLVESDERALLYEMWCTFEKKLKLLVLKSCFHVADCGQIM